MIAVLLLAAAFFAQPPAIPLSSPGQAQAIEEGLQWYCTAWMKRGASDEAQATPPHGLRAGWREGASARPAVGPILSKGGAWGNASLVRVAQPSGHRCSISMQLARDGWTTDTAHEAVTTFVAKTWPDAYKAKDRLPGPRNGRETIWNVERDMTVTLQEASAAGAQPNVFITIARTDKDGKSI